MELVGERVIAAPRQVVWLALNDPVVLRQCLPGCERLEKLSDSTFEATVTIKVGPVKTTFASSIELTEINPLNAYTISGEGKGGAAGFAKGSATVRLTERDSFTVLQYTVSASLGGKLSQFGARVVDGVARKMADDFFLQFDEIVSVPTDTGQVVAPPAVAPATQQSSRLLWMLIGLGLGVFAILGLILQKWPRLFGPLL